jgi:hypothetical protein
MLPICRNEWKESQDAIRVLRQKNIVMDLAKPGAKNECAGEGQQLFTRPADRNQY